MLTEPVFAKIYEQYQKNVFRFFLKRIVNHETARELTQEVFIKLWKSGDRGNSLYVSGDGIGEMPGTEVSGMMVSGTALDWQMQPGSASTESRLFTIAGSILVDHLRRRAHERKRLSALTSRINTESAPANNSPHKAFETADYLKAVVRQLPPARKKIILMKMGSGFTNKEIASQLSISEKTVEDHVTKALRHIRAILTLFFFSFFILMLL